MKTLSGSALFLLFVTLAACGPQPSANPCSADGGICDLATCSPGQSVASAAEAPGANCTYGGVKYTSATGVNYVCAGSLGPTGVSGAAGAQGLIGPTGAAGLDGQSVSSVVELAGLNCATGGVKYTSPSGVNYVCSGARGPNGTTGANGTNGTNGTAGVAGTQGLIGPTGTAGAVGATGSIGTTGSTGTTGAIGPTGPQGLAGGTMAFGYFYSLMGGGSTDNSAPVANDVAIEFPRIGVASGVSLKTASKSEFVLAAIGIYDISWQVSVDEPGQLVLWLNAAIQPSTVAGRAAPTSQITNHVLIATTVVNSLVTIRNAGSPAALTITPVAGGTSTVSASIVIKQIL